MPRRRLQIDRVRPSLRFRVRRNRQLVTTAEAVTLRGRSSFYHCPQCTRRTLIHWKKLNVTPSTTNWPYDGPVSPFPEDLQTGFGPVPEHSLAYDFYCKSCRAPVRLLFWIEEHYGMGGPWYPTIQWVLEPAPLWS